MPAYFFRLADLSWAKVQNVPIGGKKPDWNWNAVSRFFRNRGQTQDTEKKFLVRNREKSIIGWPPFFKVCLTFFFLGGGGYRRRKQSTFVLKSFDFLINVRQQRWAFEKLSCVSLLVQWSRNKIMGPRPGAGLEVYCIPSQWWTS